MSEEEKIPSEEIPVEDHEANGESTEQGEEKVWTEELKVTGEELMETVKNLVHEAGVRRIIIKRKEKTLLEIPLVLGVAGIALLPVYSAVALLAALVAECSILVVRAEKSPEKEPEAEATSE